MPQISKLTQFKEKAILKFPENATFFQRAMARIPVFFIGIAAMFTEIFLGMKGLFFKAEVIDASINPTTQKTDSVTKQIFQMMWKAPTNEIITQTKLARLGPAQPLVEVEPEEDFDVKEVAESCARLCNTLPFIAPDKPPDWDLDALSFCGQRHFIIDKEIHTIDQKIQEEESNPSGTNKATVDLLKDKKRAFEAYKDFSIKKGYLKDKESSQDFTFQRIKEFILETGTKKEYLQYLFEPIYRENFPSIEKDAMRNPRYLQSFLDKDGDQLLEFLTSNNPSKKQDAEALKLALGMSLIQTYDGAFLEESLKQIQDEFDKKRSQYQIPDECVLLDPTNKVWQTDYLDQFKLLTEKGLPTLEIIKTRDVFLSIDSSRIYLPYTRTFRIRLEDGVFKNAITSSGIDFSKIRIE